MAPASRNDKTGLYKRGDDYCGITADRKTRKPLVEKKRRARINESLQELRSLLADSDAQTKMENAEVLEMTVRRVESIIQSRARADNTSREARERFAAGYIQCMHEVHTFISSCPGIDASIAADLLNHLLECMPLNDEGRFHDMLSDLLESGSGGAWPGAGSEAGGSSGLSPSGYDLSSDSDDTDTERSHFSVDTVHSRDVQDAPTTVCPKSVWRPW
ncbi:transcription cofactor HES-6 isoform X2 [Electrophorus electricus]|uniref:transcription cofactor HES-6 isoform X2 n=1 Tax=Electrophorus electricus TaxID=8005 RepID=UPI000F0A9891|nr:transcription cofactor HES-6 isoform X2 [Electrophorus electricus]